MKKTSLLILTFSLIQLLSSTVSYGQVLKEKSIEKVMELKKEHQKIHPRIDGFRVQLYNGNEVDAYQVRSKFLTLFPDIKVEIIYKAPEWKVQVGNYRTRLEADKANIKIKEQFPGSLTVRARINS
ncbi:MAG: SPOR domain-containing protein [Bacteroidetes bacterium]|nr:SPOR domain-containing protein [Bacteroidota bacterium]